MGRREELFADFAGSFEYHPRRGCLYLVLAVVLAMPWILMPSNAGLSLAPFLFLLGGMGLFLKGIYLFRKSSEGIGLSLEDEVGLEEKARHKRLASFPLEAAQVIQDFGMSVLLFAPLMALSRDFERIFGRHPKLGLVVVGAVAMAIGALSKWLIRQADEDA